MKLPYRRRMMPCVNRADVDGWGDRVGGGYPIGQTPYGRKIGQGGFRFKLCNNKKWSLGPEWSLSEVEIPPPHD